MLVFDRLNGHEQVVYGSRPDGLRCIIAIHSTVLGPALGGVRLLPYIDEGQALTDALRLSEAMTYKAACAGLDIGGGKAVILGSPSGEKSETLFRSFGQLVESLGGRYIAACDMGVTLDDLSVARRESSWVHGLAKKEGGSGDSALMTAYGVYLGIRCCLQHTTGSSRLDGRHVAIDGVGKVGSRLAALLVADGARLSVCDIDSDAAERVAGSCRADVIDCEKLYLLDADVVSPNAVGAVLHSGIVSSLRCQIIAGAANNQLAHSSVADELAAKGILYAPDFVINAGGLIQVVDELHRLGPNEERVKQQTEMIPWRLRRIFWISENYQISTELSAMKMAKDRLDNVTRSGHYWLRGTS
jgi:glutamate dehydrogenase/leucine dehydrogenase